MRKTLGRLGGKFSPVPACDPGNGLDHEKEQDDSAAFPGRFDLHDFPRGLDPLDVIAVRDS